MHEHPAPDGCAGLGSCAETGGGGARASSGSGLPFSALQAVPLARDHIDGILMLENASYHMPWTRRMFEDELETERAYFWVFTDREREGAIRACGGFWDMVIDGHITKVTVAEGYRGQGLGKAVVRFLFDEMARRGLECATLEVRASNTAAIALYETCGFTRVGQRKAYYDDGETALVYTRTLQA